MYTVNIKPIKWTEYKCEQNKYGEIVPKLHMISILVEPSGGVKQRMQLPHNQLKQNICTCLTTTQHNSSG